MRQVNAGRSGYLKDFLLHPPQHAAHVSITIFVAALYRYYSSIVIHENCGNHIYDLLLSKVCIVGKLLSIRVNSLKPSVF